METVVTSIITGAMVGWIGSLVMETDSQAAILADIGVGVFGALVVAGPLRLDRCL